MIRMKMGKEDGNQCNIKEFLIIVIIVNANGILVWLVL